MELPVEERSADGRAFYGAFFERHFSVDYRSSQARNGARHRARVTPASCNSQQILSPMVAILEFVKLRVETDAEIEGIGATFFGGTSLPPR
jgi:hypothetical protein